MQTPAVICQSSRQGFTLLELMVVIVLIGIVSAMILPEMKGTFEEALLRADTREVADACQLASGRSISLNQVHRLNINSRTGQYRVETGARDRRGQLEFRPLSGVRGYDGQLDERISVRIRKASLDEASEEQQQPVAGSQSPDSAQAVLFFPDGTSEAAEITLRDRQGFTLLLKVHPVTSRVQVAELPKK